MTRFPLRVLNTIRRYGLVSSGDRVVVALSGGADSMALLHVLHELLPRLDATLAGVVHVHHGLRGDEADGDRDWCRDVAAGLGLPFREARVAVSTEAQVRGWSIERTAHLLRHAALRETADELGADRIALGHTRDDQAETVVLRFLRGAGTRGMAGMHPRRGRLIRPLLESSRGAVEQYLAERGLTYRDDRSNADLDIPRNRVRHELLPALIEVAGTALPARLARQAEVWRQEEAWLEHAAEPWVARAVEAAGQGWALHVDGLEGAPPALRHRVYWALARRLFGERATSRSVEQVSRAAALRDGHSASMGGWRVQRQGRSVRFRRESASSGGPPASGARGDERTAAVELQVPGEASLPALAVRVTAEVASRDVWALAPARMGPDAAMLDADEVEGPLVLRQWRPGDRVRPIGLGGSQKLQDLFVNRKVPLAQRSRVPIVSTPDGRVVWVVGQAVDERVAVKASTTRVVILKATHPGGKA